jgi:membrane protein
VTIAPAPPPAGAWHVPDRLRLRWNRFKRERWKAFFRYLWQRFWADNCFQYAGALSFTTVFALVPLTVSVFGILSAFPVFEEWSQRLRSYIFTNFVPATGDTIESYLTSFAANASSLTGVGIIFLIVSALLMMYSIEDAFNRIFRVTRIRSPVSRFVMYWTVLSLGPMLVVAGLAMSTYFFALPFFAELDRELRFADRLLVLLPGLVTWMALTLSYAVVPNTQVRWRHAAVGALVATILFELGKRGFAFYLTNFPSYQRIYGAFAVVPIFLFWVYLSWNIVLLGASLAAVLSSFRYHPEERKLPTGHEFAAVLRLLEALADAHAQGRGMTLEDMHDRVGGLSDEQLLRCLSDLAGLRVVEQSSLGHWRVIRDLEQVKLADIYEAGGYRIPLTRRASVDPDAADLALGAGTDGLLPVLDQSVADYVRAARRGKQPEPT